MKPTVLLDEATTPEGDHLGLYAHDGKYFLKANGAQLMTSFATASEEELARLACAPLRPARQPHVLIGGLGLGYTLAAACRALPQGGARFTVVELLPEVVRWNRTHLAALHPGLWEDPRIEVRTGDVREAIADAGEESYGAILLDTDNGPEAFVGQGNDALYTAEGLRALARVLKPGGLLGVWSAQDDPKFEKRLRQAGYDVSRSEVPAAHRGKRKRRHLIWLARKGSYPSQRHHHHA